MTMKNLSFRFAYAGIALLPLAAFGGEVFTDQASFISAIGLNYYSTDFSDVSTDTSLSSYVINGGMDDSSNPFVGTITSSLNSPGDGMLYKVVSGLSTDTDG